MLGLSTSPAFRAACPADPAASTSLIRTVDEEYLVSFLTFFLKIMLGWQFQTPLSRFNGMAPTRPFLGDMNEV